MFGEIIKKLIDTVAVEKDNISQGKLTKTSMVVLAMALLLAVYLGYSPSEPPPPPPPPPPPTTLLQPEALNYLGAFRVPRTGGNADNGLTFSYGGGGAAVRPSTNTFYLTGHSYVQLHAEVTIPEPVKSDVMTELPIAAFVQQFGDLSAGMRQNPDIWRNKDISFSGLLFWELNGAERAILSYASYYDASHNMRHSHGHSSPDIANPDPKMPFRVGDLNPGYYAGYMIPVPPEWSTQLKPVIGGTTQMAIISRSSTGPAAFGWDPQDLGAKEPVPAESYLYYPSGEATRFTPGDTWAKGPNIGGGVFAPNGLVFIGSEKTGEIWYGGGTSPNGKSDPCSSNQGVHSEGRVAVAYFYDPADLVKAKNGEVKPWEIRPYARHELKDHVAMTQTCVGLGSTTYDHSRNRLYVVQPGGEKVGSYGRYPLIHVYEIQGAK